MVLAVFRIELRTDTAELTNMRIICLLLLMTGLGADCKNASQLSVTSQRVNSSWLDLREFCVVAMIFTLSATVEQRVGCEWRHESRDSRVSVCVCYRGHSRARPYKYNSQLCFFTQRWQCVVVVSAGLIRNTPQNEGCCPYDLMTSPLIAVTSQHSPPHCHYSAVDYDTAH